MPKLNTLGIGGTLRVDGLKGGDDQVLKVPTTLNRFFLTRQSRVASANMTGPDLPRNFDKVFRSTTSPPSKHYGYRYRGK